MDWVRAERSLTTKNDHGRRNGEEVDKRKLRTDDAGLDEDRWIRKA